MISTVPKLTDAGKALLMRSNSLTISMPNAIVAPATDGNQQETQGHWYTLTGIPQKNKPTESGVFIQGNKKIVIR